MNKLNIANIIKDNYIVIEDIVVFSIERIEFRFTTDMFEQFSAIIKYNEDIKTIGDIITYASLFSTEDGE